MPNETLCTSGSCVPNNTYAIETEDQLLTMTWAGGELRTEKDLKFNIEAQNEGETGNYRHTWKLTGDTGFELDLVMFPDTDYGPTIFGYNATFVYGVARNSVGTTVQLPLPARYSIFIDDNNIRYARFNNGTQLVYPLGTLINIFLSTVIPGQCVGEREWISNDPVTSYTIEEGGGPDIVNPASPNVQYFPESTQVTIEWNGYTYTSNNPPVSYQLYNLNLHAIAFSVFDPNYNAMLATLDSNSVHYRYYSDGARTVVVFHAGINYAVGGYGYTKDTTTLNALQISAGFTIPSDGICRLNVPLIGGPTLAFDFPDDNPTSSTTFACPSISRPNAGSWIYFVYDATGLVQTEYYWARFATTLPNFNTVVVTGLGSSEGWTLTFQPQGQSFTFDEACQPTNVTINLTDNVDPNYILRIYEAEVLSRTIEFPTDPLSGIAISRYTGSKKYTLTIMGSAFAREEDTKFDNVENFKQVYEFIDFDPTENEALFRITQAPYSRFYNTGDPASLDVTSPEYGEYTCTTTNAYTLPIENGPVNAITFKDGETDEWVVKYFDSTGSVLNTDFFQQQPIIIGNELFKDNFAYAIDPITGNEFIIPNPIKVGGISPSDTLIPGTQLIVNGESYTVADQVIQPINPNLVAPDVITPISQGPNGEFDFTVDGSEPVTFDYFVNSGGFSSTTPQTTLNLTGIGTSNDLQITIPPFDPNIDFSYLANLGNNNLQPTEPNNRPIVDLNYQGAPVVCNCPDSTRTRTYVSDDPNEGVTIDWSNSGAGAKTILGCVCCKHTFSVLISNNLVGPYKPKDMQPDPVPSDQYTKGGWVGDQSESFDDFLISGSGFNVPTNKKNRQTFL